MRTRLLILTLLTPRQRPCSGFGPWFSRAGAIRPVHRHILCGYSNWWPPAITAMSRTPFAELQRRLLPQPERGVKHISAPPKQEPQEPARRVHPHRTTAGCSYCRVEGHHNQRADFGRAIWG